MAVELVRFYCFRFSLLVFMPAEGPMMKIMREAMPRLQQESAVKVECMFSERVATIYT
jgi:hypothetical protein